MDFLIDIGRVLLDFDFERSLARLIPPGMTGADEALRLLQVRKDEFEAGAIGVEEYTEWGLRTLGSDATHEEFQDAWRHIFTPVPRMWESIRRLKARGDRLILFSNTNAIHFPWGFGEFDIFREFDGAVLSYEVGAIKPHEEIYRHAVREWGLDPSRTGYVDDLAENIETGRRLGFLTWMYDMRDHDAFEAWLERLPDGLTGQ